MTQYNSVNVKISNSKIDKLKLLTKSETGITMQLSSNMIGILLIFYIDYY